MGGSLVVQAGVSGLTSVAGGATTRALLGQEQSFQASAQDFAVGVVTFGLVKGGSAGLRAVKNAVTQQLETQASSEALAARVAARRASPPAAPPPTTQTPPAPEPLPATQSPPTDGPPTTLPRSIPAPSRLIDRSVPSERYFVQDPASPRFYAEGTVSPRGELSISIRTVLETGQRSTLLRGAEQFQNIVRFFRGQFTAIKGNWQFGTNLARFNELTAQGLSPEAAAARTWTGQQAAAAGFRTVRVQSLQGTPRKYTSVQVLFTE